MNHQHRKHARLTSFLRTALKPLFAVCAFGPVFAFHTASAQTTYYWEVPAGGNWDFSSTNWNTTNATPPTTQWNGGSAVPINNIASFGATPTGGDTAISVNATINLGGLTFTAGTLATSFYDIQSGTSTGLTFTGQSVITANPGVAGVITTPLNTDTVSATPSTDTLTFTGNSTGASGGTIYLNGNNATYTVPLITITGGVTVASSASNGALPNVATVVGTGGTGGTIDLLGNNGVIASLAGDSSGTITNSNTAYANLTIGGPSTPTSPTIYAGAITDSAATNSTTIETTNNLAPAGVGDLSLTIQAPTTGYTLELTGNNNTYHGMTVVGDGTNPAKLQAGILNAFSQNSVVNVLANSTLDLNSFSQTIVALNGSGTGTVTNGSFGSTAALTLNGDGLADTLSSSANIIDHATNPVLYGILAIVKNGAYTQVLAGTNTYGGGTAVNVGTLANGSLNGFSPNSSYTVASVAFLDLNGFNSSVGSLQGAGTVENGSGNVNGSTPSSVATLTTGSDNTSTTFSGFIKDGSGGLALTKVGTGVFTLTNTDTYSGATLVSAGVLQIGDGVTGGNLPNTSGVTVANNATLVTDLVTGATFTRNIFLNGTNAALTAVQSGTNTLSGIISGTGILNQTGTGKTILTNDETYTGATTITAGTLSLAATGSIAAGSTVGVGTAGTLNFAAGGIVFGNATLTGGATVTGSGGTIGGTLGVTGGNWNATSGTVTGLVTASGAANTFTIGAGANLTATAGVNLTGGQIAGTGTLTGSLNDTSAQSSTFGGVIANGASPSTLTVDNAATTLTLTGTNTYTGMTKVTSGTLSLTSTGSIAAGSTVGVDAKGTLNFVGGGNVFGNATLNGGATVTGSGGTIGGTLGVTGGNWNATSGTVTGLVTASGAANTFTIGAGANLTATAGVNLTGGQIAGPGTLTGSLNDTSAQSSTFGGVIANGASPSTLTVNNAATTLTLTGVNTYTGDTKITSGTLSLGPTASIAAGSTVGVDNKGILNFAAGGSVLGNATLTGGAAVTGSGGTIGGTLAVSGGNWNATSGTVQGLVTASGAANTFTIGSGANLTAASGVNVTGGQIAGTGTLTGSLGYTSAQSSTFGGVIADGASPSTLTVNNAATTLTLTGANTYTGMTKVTSGTLSLGPTGSIAAGSTVGVDNAGTLNFAGGGTVAGNATLTGGATVTGSGGTIGGTLGVTGGNWNATSGTVTGLVTATGDANTFTIGAGANLTATSGVNLTGGQIAGTGTLTGSLTDTSAQSSTFGGVIAGAGNTLTINNAATTLTLTGANTYTGATTVTAGTLSLGPTGSIAAGSTVGVGAAGTLNFAAGGSVLGNATLKGGATVTGSGGTIGGTLGVTGGNWNATSGTVTGLVTASGAGNTFTIGTGANLTATSGVNLTGGQIAGTGTLTGSLTDTSAQSSTFGGVIAGAGNTLAVNNAATTLTLTGANTYTGATTVTAGTLSLGPTGSIAAGSTVGVGTAGTLNFAGGGSVLGNATLTGGATVTGSGGTIGGTLGVTGGNWNATSGTVTGLVTASGAGNTFTIGAGANLTATTGVNLTGGQIGGTGTLTGSLNDTSAQSSAFGGVIAGAGNTLTVNNAATTLTLTGTDTFTGATTVTAGTLQVGNGTSGTLTGTSGVTVANNGVLATDLASGATFTPAIFLNGTTAALNAIQTGTNTLSGVISGTGVFNQTGSGTTILTNAETYTGATTVSAGTLSLTSTGSIAAGSTVGVGAAGTLNFASGGTVLGNATLTGGATVTGSGGTIGGTLGVTGGNWNATSGTVNGLVTASGAANTFTIGAGASLTAAAGVNLTGGQIAGPGTLAGSLNDTSAQSSTFGGVIANGASPSALTVNNAATTLTLTSANTYTGGTTLQAGALVVANSAALGGGNVTVTGGALRASGPSMRISVGGNYTQGSGGELDLRIGGTTPGSFDRLTVAGSASVGGRLSVSAINGFIPKEGESLAVITAGGGVTGRFQQLTDNIPSYPLIKATLAYLPNEVLLDFTQGSFIAAASTYDLHLTPNERAVAAALDGVPTNAASIKLLNVLDALPLQSLPGAFNLIAPAEYGAIFEISRSAAKMEAVTVQNRLDEVHAGSVVTIASGPAGPSDDKGSKEVMPPPEHRLSFFANGSGEFVAVGDSTNAAGYNFGSGAATVGVDYRFTEHFVAGVLLNYTGTNADLLGNGRINANAFRGGIYASIFGGGAYVNAYLGGAASDYDVSRPGLGSLARGSTGGGDFNALITTGYDVHAGNFTYGPVGSFQYTYTGLDSFDETGSLAPLHINSNSGDSFLTNLGARATYDWHIGSMVLVPEVRATWQHEYGDTFDSISAAMLLGSPAFSVTSSPIGRDSLLLNAGFTLRITPDLSVYAFYDGELARTNYQANNLLVGFRASF